MLLCLMLPLLLFFNHSLPLLPVSLKISAFTIGYIKTSGLTQIGFFFFLVIEQNALLSFTIISFSVAVFFRSLSIALCTDFIHMLSLHTTIISNDSFSSCAFSLLLQRFALPSTLHISITHKHTFSS